MNDHCATITAIDDLLRTLQRNKVTRDMWCGADLERMRMESELIELRTRCERWECSPAQARDRLRAHARRNSVRMRRGRRHPQLEARLMRFALVQPWYRDLLLVGVTAMSCVATIAAVVMVAT